MTGEDIALFVVFMALLVGSLVFSCWMLTVAVAWRNNNYSDKLSDVQRHMAKYYWRALDSSSNNNAAQEAEEEEGVGARK